MPSRKKPLEHTVFCAIRSKGRGVYPDLYTAAFHAPGTIRKVILDDRRNTNKRSSSKWKHGRIIGIVKYKMVEEKRLTREEMAAYTGNAD